MVRISILLAVLFSASAWAACSGSSPTLTAASAARNDVNDCVTAAVDGDTIMIPNGSATWTSGITTSKQIWIRAQNYTPTAGGDTTRNVVITNNNSSGALFTFTTGNSYHVALSGIRFNEGTAITNYLVVNGTGSKVALISDVYFEIQERNGSQEDISPIYWTAKGGVMWNCRFEGIGTGGVQGVGAFSSSLTMHPTAPVWNSASTMGSLDTDGTNNLYVEDCSCLNVGAIPDADDHARGVFRYNTFDGCWGLTHGFTSTWGGRFIEWYNNTFSVTNELRNIAGRYFWIRAGTALFTDNVVNNASFPSSYGNVSMLNIGDNTSPGSYPMPRQPGWGHNGTTDVIDPIYMWSQTGARAYTWGFQSQPGGWETIVLENREVYVNNGAKPGYSKYTYPHPARSELGGGGGGGGSTRSSATGGGLRLSGGVRIQ